ncbi:MAG: hypothetical protein JWR44_2435 [Hymenobacter sp.]|jgi:hypothetical protein|nr:hypothetical protein [Hymenobacter sp.]
MKTPLRIRLSRYSRAAPRAQRIKFILARHRRQEQMELHAPDDDEQRAVAERFARKAQSGFGQIG